MQAVDSESGEVADETVLRKPHGWRNSPDGRLRTIALFYANYTPVRIAALILMLGYASHFLPHAQDCR